VPSNDFGGQEPGGSKEIAETAQHQYGVTSDCGQSRREGANAHPFYNGRRGAAEGLPRWNFHKYLIAATAMSPMCLRSRSNRRTPNKDRHCARAGGHLTAIQKVTGSGRSGHLGIKDATMAAHLDQLS